MIPVSKPSVGKEELELLSKVFESNWLGLGSYVTDFENQIKDYIGVGNVVAVNSGTSALHLALEASGISSGDEVIVPSLTFVACVQAISALGGHPVFCEVLPETLCIDPDKIEELITSKTKAIMPVHFCGIAVQMDKILRIGTNYNLIVVEDAAHAFGSSSSGSKIGSYGDVTCFSFDPIKNITCGEGGAITTNNDTLAALIRKKRILGIDNDSWYRREHNLKTGYDVTTQGYRYHMSNISAAIGLAQFRKIESFRMAKTKIVARYNETFSGIEEISILNWNLKETFPFIYCMRVPEVRRDLLIAHLEEKGIGSSINYIPNHFHKFYNNGQKLPITESLFKEIITLPLFTDMTEQESEHVINTVQTFFTR